MYKISRAVVFRKKHELKIPFRHASSGEITYLDDVYVKLETEDGHVGYGEVRGNCHYTTGDTASGIAATLSDVLLPNIMGHQALELNRIHYQMERLIMGNNAAKAVCENALYDLIGNIHNLPVHSLLGGKLAEYLPTEENIPFCSLEETEVLAREYLTSGCRFIKIRVGLEPFANDVARVAKVQEVTQNMGLADYVEIAVDANQAWDPKTAMERITQLLQYGVTVVEQPVPFGHVSGLRWLKESCPVKIFADESILSTRDLALMAAERVIDGVHIKLVKCGGISNALRMMHIAEAHGLGFIMGGMDEGMLAVAAAVHCGAVANTKLFELNNHRRIKEDATTGLIVSHGVVKVPDGPGFGVSVNENLLTKVCEVTA